MDWDTLDKKIVKTKGYQFFTKHRRFIMMIEGIIIIGLMVGILFFFVGDREIKEQIRDTCGYETDKYACVCEQKVVDFFNDEKLGQINLTYNSDVSLVR